MSNPLGCLDHSEWLTNRSRKGALAANIIERSLGVQGVLGQIHEEGTARVELGLPQIVQLFAFRLGHLRARKTFSGNDVRTCRSRAGSSGVNLPAGIGANLAEKKIELDFRAKPLHA